MAENNPWPNGLILSTNHFQVEKRTRMVQPSKRERAVIRAPMGKSRRHLLLLGGETDRVPMYESLLARLAREGHSCHLLLFFSWTCTSMPVPHLASQAVQSTVRQTRDGRTPKRRPESI